MFRAFWVMFFLGVVAVITMWLADHPGQVSVTWHGYVIETSAAVMIGIITSIVILTALIYRFWIFVRGVPAGISWLRGEGRRRKGYLALSRGMIAVAAGDSDEARRQAKWANRLIEEPSLTLLLSAQSAQLNGDEDSAKIFFTTMLENPDTEFLGLRGLLNQATKKGDSYQALKWIRRAYKLKPKSEWVFTMMFDLTSRAELWNEAYDALNTAVGKKLVGPLEAKHSKAVLYHQMSMEAEVSGDIAKALELSKKAAKEEPKFNPAQIRLAQLLMSSGNKDKAIRSLEAAWAISPHPEIASTYLPLIDANNAELRMKAANRLAGFNRKDPVTKLMLVKNALDAELWSDARKYLEEIGASDEPITSSYCQLMAKLEESENSDMVAVQKWLLRAVSADADPLWVCDDCSNVSDVWSALCGSCSGFDKLQWRCPSRLPGLGESKEYDTVTSSLVCPNEVVLQDIDVNRTAK